MAASSVNQLAAAVLPRNERSQRLRKLSHRTWCPSGSIWTPKMCRTSAISARPCVPGGAIFHFALWKLHLTAYSTLHEMDSTRRIFLEFQQLLSVMKKQVRSQIGNINQKAQFNSSFLNKSAIDIFLLTKPIISISPSSAGCSLVVLLQHWIQRVPTAKWNPWPTSEASKTTRKCKAPWLSFV